MIENEYGQPVGEIVENLSAGSLPQVQLLQGRFCRLEKLSAEKHGSSLREVYASPPENWTYLSIGPITDADGLAAYLAKLEQSADPYWFAIVEQESGRAVGTVALMRTDTANRTIEVGWVVYGEKLKRTRAATEAQFLLMQYVFETLHYRRTAGFHLRRHFPPRPHQPRPQPRYQLVFGNRQRMAGTQTAVS